MNELLEKAHDKLFRNESNHYIFIYTPPKVGSTTLMTSLRVCLGKSYNILHVHDELMLKVLTGISTITIIDLIQFIANNNKIVYVIDVYRSPIERKISEYFEQLANLHFNNTENNINSYPISKISERFNCLFPHLSKEEHYFDKYCISNPPEFNFIQKYTMQNINKVTYIKLRLKDTNTWGIILSEIFSQRIVIINDYQSCDKKIGELYNRFKLDYKIPINLFQQIENCKYLRFYYSEEERREYLDIWRKKLCVFFSPYNEIEYSFYIKICLENQYYNIIQTEHYIDNGCFCKACGIKRKEIYFKALKNEPNTEKIIHEHAVIELQQKIKLENMRKIKWVNQNKRNKNNSKKINTQLL
jgi:hypothetical protein